MSQPDWDPLKLILDECDEDEAPPTPAAREAVRELLSQARKVVESLSTRPSYTLIGDGGLSARWEKDDRTVTLIVPPTGIEQASLYRRTPGGDSELSHEITADRLAEWLDWLDQQTPALTGV